jgi:hypothetical protein
MNSSSARLGRRLAATALGLLMAGVALTAPARADTPVGNPPNRSSDIPESIGTIGQSLGGPITRAQIIQRAQDWVANDVGYYPVTTEGWYDSTVGGPYRMDCSGMASMSWGLASDPPTEGLADSSLDTVVPASQLQEGDLFDDPADHVVIFYKWIDQAAGTFEYYYEGSTSHPAILGTDGDLNSAELDGHPTSSYEGLQYKNLTSSGGSDGDDGITPTDIVVGSSGQSYFSRDAANGDLVNTYYNASGWSVFDLTASENSPAMAPGTPDVVTNANGTVDIFTTAADGHLISTYDDVSGAWHVFDLTASEGAPSVAGSPMAVENSDGTYTITVRSTAGDLVSVYDDAAGAWHVFDFTVSEGAPTITGNPDLVAGADGTEDIFATSAAGHLVSVYDDASGAWHVFDLTASEGAPSVAGSPMAVENSNGTYTITVRSTAGDLVSVYDDAAGAWHVFDFTVSEGAPTITGNPDVVAGADGTEDIFATSTAGHLVSVYDDASGAWHVFDLTASEGAPSITESPTAVYTSANNTYEVLVRTAAGHLVSVHDDASGTWSVFDLTSSENAPLV